MDAWILWPLRPEMPGVDQHSTGTHPAVTTDEVIVWIAQGLEGTRVKTESPVFLARNVMV
jgi:hypothetical protein